MRKLLKGQDSAPTGKVTRTAQRDTNEPNKTKKSRYFISFFKKKEKQIQQFIPGVRYITSRGDLRSKIIKLIINSNWIQPDFIVFEKIQWNPKKKKKRPSVYFSASACAELRWRGKLKTAPFSFKSVSGNVSNHMTQSNGLEIKYRPDYTLVLPIRPRDFNLNSFNIFLKKWMKRYVHDDHPGASYRMTAIRR